MKAGIVTINDDNNYGNKLQNYAVQIFLENNNIDVKTIKNMPNINNKEKSKLKYYKKRLRNHLHKIKIKTVQLYIYLITFINKKKIYFYILSS